VYEVLNHKRPLTLRMIRNLNKGLGISAQVLIAENDKTPQSATA
jgi:HTH-type transcriptional regulator/antitoxin HigA